MKTFETLSQAVTNLEQRGYNHDFNLHPEWIECAPLSRKFLPQEFHVDEVHRFEGVSNPDDNSILFAISSSDGVKGLLIDAYGMYSDSLSPTMIEKLTIDKKTNFRK
jgi:hypothetical protein